MESIDTERLIALVETHPVIWDKMREEHRDRSKMRDAWIVVCSQLRGDFDSLTLPEKRAFRKCHFTSLL